MFGCLPRDDEISEEESSVVEHDAEQVSALETFIDCREFPENIGKPVEITVTADSGSKTLNSLTSQSVTSGSGEISESWSDGVSD